MRYTFEVVRSILGDYEHMGYMKISFASPSEAAAYYNRTNPRMRPFGPRTRISDVHPETGLMYIVREDYGIRAKIAPFHARARL